MTDRLSTLPIIVVGAGAAGLVAAGFAAASSREVFLLERTSDGGRKILISGGGRCNILPSRLSASDYVTASSPSILKKILRSWPLKEQRQFFEEVIGLPLKLEEETGKMFPRSDRARDVRDGLVEWCRKNGVRFRFNVDVIDVRPGERGGWNVELASGELLEAAAVILSTGGLSVPKTGSDGTGLSIARRLGLRINPIYPALTPLTATPTVHADLAGISLNVRLEAPAEDGRYSTEGGFLFTHRGYSGPSVLNISHRAILSRMKNGGRGDHQKIFVRWDERGEEEWRRYLLDGGRRRVITLLQEIFPHRLATMLLEVSGVEPERNASELKREERETLITTLIRYPLPWTADEGYKKGEVTGGGVALEEINPKSMETHAHPGLYLCGEMLDAFGPIGGYNFLWAWSTGRGAGIGAAETL